MELICFEPCQKAFGRVSPQMTALGWGCSCIALSSPNVGFNSSMLSISNAGTVNLADSAHTLFLSWPISSHLNWEMSPGATTAFEAAWIPNWIVHLPCAFYALSRITCKSLQKCWLWLFLLGNLYVCVCLCVCVAVYVCIHVYTYRSVNM